MPMTLSIVLTIHNRPPEVSRAVADSFLLPGNQADEFIVVLDRPTSEARIGAVGAYEPLNARFVHINGEPGWKGPARAWNAGFKAATGDLLYCISSEVVQEPGNVAEAKSQAADGKTAVFGACHNSTPENLVVGAEPGLLVSSKMPRPLGFIVCMPAAYVRKIGGFDEDFMNGLWYDDDDFFLRLWQAGADFSFYDRIHGTHLHHDRPVLATPEGQAAIARNQALMLKKHGTTHPWSTLPKLVYGARGQLHWKHL